MYSKSKKFLMCPLYYIKAQVLKENGKQASTKSYMWTYVTGDYDNQMVIYEYQPSRAHRDFFK